MRSQQGFSSFTQHQERSTPRKDYERLYCEKCRFTTKDVELFQRHVSHHKEVTFSCALCGHVSFSKTESQKHIVLHTGAFPYRCTFCSYGAVRRDYLLKHIKRMHHKHADEPDLTVPGSECGHPSVLETPWMPGWLKKNEGPNSKVESPLGSQTVNASCVKAQSPSQTNCTHVTIMKTPSVANKTAVLSLPRAQFSSTTPCCQNTSGQTTQADNCSWSNTSLHGTLHNNSTQIHSTQLNSSNYSQLSSKNLVSHKRSFSDRLKTTSPFTTPKRTIPQNPAEPLKNPRVPVPDKAMQVKSIPRVQVRAPIQTTSRLGDQFNVPLSKREVQSDARRGQLSAGNHSIIQKTIPFASSSLKSPPNFTAESSRQLRTNTKRTLESLTEAESPLPKVQVELLAPLNQPIQHNKPLTVSCPEEIKIPAGCLVELVEVKNINGTRELELRLVPAGTAPQNKKTTVDNGCVQEKPEGNQIAPGKSSFGISTSSANLYQIQPHQTSGFTKAAGISKKVSFANNPLPETSFRTKSLIKANNSHNKVALKGPGLSSQGLPIISSVFSLCPAPLRSQSLPQSPPESQPKKVVTKEKNSTQSLVCSILVKKEDESEEKPKITHIDTHPEKDGPSRVSETSTALKALSKTQFKQPSDQILTPKRIIIPSKKDVIIQDEGAGKCGGTVDGQQQPLMYPRVHLFRIPSSLIGHIGKAPEAREQSVIARPVLSCTISEQNVSGGAGVAIKLILKRSHPQLKDQDSPLSKRHKKERLKAKKQKRSKELVCSSCKGLKLIPLKPNQLISTPGPNQPVVVLNHPNPPIWKNHKQQEAKRKMPPLKMRLKRIRGQGYQVIELLLNGVSEEPAT